jgi:hypothetical protein
MEVEDLRVKKQRAGVLELNRRLEILFYKQCERQETKQVDGSIPWYVEQKDMKL